MDRQDKITYQNQLFYQQQFSSEAELEELIAQNSRQIFKPDSYFTTLKTKLGTSGAQTIPDGYLLDFSEDTCKLYLVEVELSHHHAYNHILAQMGKFNNLNGVDYYKLRQLLIDELDLPPPHLNLFKQYYPDPSQPISIILIADQFPSRIYQAVQKLQYQPELIVVQKYQNQQGKDLVRSQTLDKNLLPTSHFIPLQCPHQSTRSYDYQLEQLNISLVAQSEYEYHYTYDAVISPLFSKVAPLRLKTECFDSTGEIQLLSTTNFVASPGQNERNAITLQTDFQSPVIPNHPIKSSFSLYALDRNLPPHVQFTLPGPITQDIAIQIDLSLHRKKYQAARLYQFESIRASRPLENLDGFTNVVPFEQNSLHWILDKKILKAGQVYLITWSDKCNCNFCQQKIFES